MQSERRRYNYNVNSTSYGYTRTPMTPRAINFDATENRSAAKPLYNESYCQKITQLESANKKLVDETARQFQKFQQDIVRVEGILQEKENRVEELEADNLAIKEDKALLIQALKQKQQIIHELKDKLTDLLTNNTPPNKNTQAAEEKPAPSIPIESGIQTEQVQQDEGVSKKLEESVRKNISLEQQVCRLKQQLFASNSELNLIQQQFSTYKLLHEIDLAKNDE